jgi:hypothetical protein
LTQKVIGLSVSEEYLHLVNTINDMIDGLGFFASEVKVALEVGTLGNLGVQAEAGNAQGIWQENYVRHPRFQIQIVLTRNHPKECQSIPWPAT